MHFLDVCVLVVSLAGISIIGLWTSKKQKNVTSRDVMIGSGVSVWSVTLSVCSGFISSISLLGFPAEIYYQGSMLAWYAVTYLIGFPMAAYLFLPVLYNLKLTSIYEYLELRFDMNCRIVGLGLFCLQTLLYNAVALYAPALALSSTTGITLNVSIVITALLSAAYISIGGARAGIHTSALQMALIFISMGSIVVLGWSSGKFDNIFTDAINGSRLTLDDFRVDPRVRHTSWSVVIGGTGNILCLFAANQLSIQKYMALPTLKQAQRVVLLNIVCNLFILVTYIFIGLMIYTTYKDCHPIISSKNEIFPKFVVDTLSHIPGSVGLFAAAVYSAGISTLSASFSAVSTVLVQDGHRIMRKRFDGNQNMPEELSLTLSKYLPIILASISIVFAWICSHLKSLLLQIALSVFGAVGGPVLGSFVVGLFMPSIRGRSGVVGLVASTLICNSIALGSVFNKITPVVLPISTECYNTTSPFYDADTFGLVTPFDSSSVFVEITKISYQYYSIIGVISNVLFAASYQYLFGNSYNAKLSSELLSPYALSESDNGEIEMESLEPARVLDLDELAKRPEVSTA